MRDPLLDSHHILRPTLHVGQHADLVQLFDRQLAHGVEGAERVDLVVEELDAEGVLVGVGVDIHDAAAHGVLAGLHDKVDTVEVVLLEGLDDEVHIDLGSFGYAEGVARQGAFRHHLLIQGFRVAHHREAAAGGQLLHHLAALHDIGIVGLEQVAAVVFAAALAAVGGGEKQHALLFDVGIGLFQQVLQVVEKIVGLFLAGCNEELSAVGTPQGHTGPRHGGQSARHAVHMDAVRTLLQQFHEFPRQA